VHFDPSATGARSMVEAIQDAGYGSEVVDMGKDLGVQVSRLRALQLTHTDTVHNF
jgi:hypothetical protein